MNMHGIAKVPDDPLGAEAARLNFVRIASFTMQHLLVADGHAASTHPVLAVARVNMVEIGQTGTLWTPWKVVTLSEYQIGCEDKQEIDTLGFNPKELRLWRKYVKCADAGRSSATGSATRTT